MSDDLRRLEERLNSKLELQFELYNQGMTLLRNNLKGRLLEQEQRIQEAMLAQMQQVQSALSAQRHILEESLLQQQELFRNTNEGIRGALNESFTWLHSLDDRVSAIEEKLAG